MHAAEALQLRDVSGWEQDERGARVWFDGAVLSVAVLTPGTVRVRLGRDGRLALRRSWAATRPDGEFPVPEHGVTQAADGSIRVETDELVLEARSGGRVDVYDREGMPVLLDCDGGPTWSGEEPETTWTKWMPDDARYYGFGERTGLLEKRGRRYTCWTTDEWRHQGPTTDELYVAIPFFLGLGGTGQSYGVFLDSTFRTWFDLTDLARRRLRFGFDDGEAGYYVFYGPEPARVLERFTELVGRMPLPPRWALGYHQSRWGYESADEILETARRLRSDRIPADAVHFDIDHMHAYRVFTWDPERFPDPAGLVDELHGLGFRTVALVGPGVLQSPNYDIYVDGRRRNAFLRSGSGADDDEFTGYVWPGLCVFPDFVRPDVREWWGALYTRHLEVGIDGFLNDMNEPAMHDRPMDAPDTHNLEPPLDLRHGPVDEPVTHAEARNIYAYLENRATYEFLRDVRPDERPFLLSRSGYAGLQRYAGVWTGDLSSVWEHLDASLPQCLNLGLSGIALSGADIGGFFESCGPELLVRWTQLGALMPFARNHSARGTAPQEPWAWGEAVEDACRRALELRYRLLPYLYTLFEECARTGVPVVRPPFLHYPNDPATHFLSDEALVGRDLLVAPVVRPGVTRRAVYFPPGRWVDFRSGARHDGPGWDLVSATLAEDVPLFALEGSVIPLGPVLQWTDERPLDPLTLVVFPDGAGRAEGALYEDDGRTFAYKRGGWRRTTFAYADGRLDQRREGSFDPGERRVEVEVR